MEKKPKVKEVTLTIKDLEHLEKFIQTTMGADSLDVVEILVEIERIKNVSLDF